MEKVRYKLEVLRFDTYLIIKRGEKKLSEKVIYGIIDKLPLDLLVTKDNKIFQKSKFDTYTLKEKLAVGIDYEAIKINNQYEITLIGNIIDSIKPYK